MSTTQLGSVRLRGMSRRRLTHPVVIALVCAALLPLSATSWAAAATPAYTLTDLGTLPAASGSTASSAAYGIDNSGDVVGVSLDHAPTGTASHAYRWTPSTGMKSIDANLPGASGALKINDAGQVVGKDDRPDGSQGAVVWSATNSPQFIPNGAAGFVPDEADGINANGVVVGMGHDTFANRGYVWDPRSSAPTELGLFPGADQNNSSRAFGINDAGDIVGDSLVGGATHALVQKSGVVSALPEDGSIGGSSAADINAAGQIVGLADSAVLWDPDPVTGAYRVTHIGPSGGKAEAINANGVVVGETFFSSVGPRAFVWTSSQGLVNVNDAIPANSGLTLTYAFDVNDHGQIVGVGFDAAGVDHAVLLTPAGPPPPPALHAGFTLSPSSGHAPLTVRFTDTSTGNPTTYSWDFGDSSARSSDRNPSHVYLTGGTFTVTLTISDGVVNATGTQTVTVDSALPVAYYALGDSYSSGEGVPPFDPNTDLTTDVCHRSTSGAYARMVAQATGADLGVPAVPGNSPAHFVACSGARIRNVTGNVGMDSEPSQISRVKSGANLITITVGGDDVYGVNARGQLVVGFGDLLRSCITAKMPCDKEFANIALTIPTLEAPLVAAYRRIHSVAPSAKILVLTYPQIFAANPGRSCGGLDPSEVNFVRTRTSQLNGVIKRAAATANAGVRVVDAETAFNGHLLCGNPLDPWASGLVIDKQAYSFHPNQSGQAKLAGLIEAELARVS